MSYGPAPETAKEPRWTFYDAAPTGAGVRSLMDIYFAIRGNNTMSMSIPGRLSGGLCVLALALVAAENPFVGTWKQNAIKSKMEGSGLGTNATVHIEQANPGLKVSVEATLQGQPNNYTYQATLDGKLTKVIGSAAMDEVGTLRFNDRSFTATGKKDGKVVFTDRRIVSSNGKSLTISRSGTNAEGKPYQATMVFDKQ